MSFWSYKRFSIRILNFAEFSRCYSIIKNLAGVGYTDESGLPVVAYTGEPDHPGGLHRGVHKNFVLT
jgi:hypothetical protein